MTNQRPNPDLLLEQAKEEERKEHSGKLKIYLGAAPGVGKTHEMLHDALEKRKQGLDLIIGIAESHGRKEIEDLLANFEILPRQKVLYKEKECSEFDLDAALKRNPGLILVDEMAHTNVPGLRHAKRWQDIKELLDRGINVHTTLNVQHLESLKDDIARIIQAPIHETVPNSMLERADSIELVDLPPEELLNRLREGKIYFPQQAELAQEHFFRKANLIALRELALRTTAEQVDTDVLWYRQVEGIKEVWPVKEKILVCVGPSAEALKLIRTTKRLATSLQAEWLAIYIDTPRQSKIELRNLAIKNLRLAELLGAQTHVLTGLDVAKEILTFAREQNVNQIVIWKNIHKRWNQWFRSSLADEIVRYSEEINVYIVTGGSVKSKTNGEKKSIKLISWKTYLLSLAVTTIATLINTALYPLLTASNLIMVYLVGVSFVALLGQRGPALLASFLSIMAYVFFFIPPFYNLIIPDFEYFFTLLAMLLVTQIISHLTILTKRQDEINALVRKQTTELYTFSRKLITTRGTKAILGLGANHIAHTFNSQVMILTPKNSHIAIQVSHPEVINLTAKEYSIAQWVFDLGQAAGFGTDTLSSADALYLPIIGSSNKSLGVLRIQALSHQLLSPEQRTFLDSCLSQLALALEVDGLHEKNQKRELEHEKNLAQTAILSSIFHDLSYPLKRVTHAIHNAIKAEPTQEAEIRHEINKLNHLNNKLSQIIQIESEGIRLKKEPCSLKTILSLATEQANRTLEYRPYHIDIIEPVPMIHLDNLLIQTVFLHLLDNAIKFSPQNSKISISAQSAETGLLISIADLGSGFTLDDKNKLFERFYRGKRAKKHGLGIGLAICKKIIQAHQGKIWVENLSPKGAVVHIVLPLN